MRKSIFYLFIGVFAILQTACDEQKTPEQQAMSVTVGKPTFEIITEWNEYSGRFQAVDRVEIRSRVSGYLEKILFKDGQEVSAGETLFIIDQRPFKIALSRAEASYELAKKELARASVLRDKNVTSAQAFDRREQEFRDAEAALNDAKLNLEFTEVKAPIAGKVGRHLIDIGNLVQGGDANSAILTTVVSMDPIHFYIEASEQEFLKYQRQAFKTVRTQAPKKEVKTFVRLLDEEEFKHPGVLDFLDNQIDRASGTIELRAVLENTDKQLIPGLFGRMRVPAGEPYEAMLIPDRIIGTNQTIKFVYVVNKENRVEIRPIEIGPLHNREMRIVRSGITKEDNIIVDGYAMVRPGMPVNPKQQGQSHQTDSNQPPQVELMQDQKDKS